MQLFNLSNVLVQMFLLKENYDYIIGVHKRSSLVNVTKKKLVDQVIESSHINSYDLFPYS